MTAERAARALDVDRWLPRVPSVALAGIYIANLALPVLMAASAGLWPAAVVASLPFAIVLSRSGIATRRSSIPT